MPQPAKPQPIPESERKYDKLSAKEMDAVLNDLKEHLRITKIFNTFRDLNSSHSTIN